MAGPYTQGMSFLPDDPWELSWDVPETPVAETTPPLRGTFNALDELYPAIRETIAPNRETGFRDWYAAQAKRWNLSADPDDPRHQYDYRAAYRAGATPDQSGHWPSQYKRQGHPNRFVEIDGVLTDTITGKPAPTSPTRRDGSILASTLEDLFNAGTAAPTPFNAALKIARAELPLIQHGFVRGAEGLAQTYGQVVHGDPNIELMPRTELDEMVTVKTAFENPTLAAKQALTMAASMWPMAALGAAGGAAGAASIAGAGTEMLGMIGGTMLGTLAQSLGPHFASSLAETPDDPDAAYEKAITATTIDVGTAGAGAILAGGAFVRGPLKNAMFQIFGAQPAAGVIGAEARRAVTGEESPALADEYLAMLAPGVVMTGLGVLSVRDHPTLTPRAAAEPWTLPWSKTGEAYEIDPAIAAAVPEEGGPGAQDHPAARFGAMQRVEKPIDAWHGSPHDFDEFRMSQNLGRGEGNTAFGEGGYFGEERQTGETYRQSLTDTHRSPDVKTKNARVPRWLANRIAARADKAEAIAEARRDFEARVAEAKAEAEAPDNIQPWMAEQQVPNLMEVLRGIDDIEKHGVPDLKGKLYNVNLHLKPEQVVDWDAPIAEQPDIVRKLAKEYQPPDQQKPPRDALAVIKAALKEAEGLPSQDHVALIIDNDQRLHEAAWAHAKAVLPKQQYLTMEAHGDSIGNWLARRHGGFIEREGFGARSGGELLGLMEAKHGRDGTAKLLRDAGMRGIRYLDQLSRGAGEKETRNYVVFHDEDVEIKAKFQRGIGDNKPPEAMEPFYYKSERLLPTLAAKAPAKQWDATLRNKGVKAEELEDLGIAEFLKNAGDTVVTREQVQALIDANRAEFKEVTYGGDQGLRVEPNPDVEGEFNVVAANGRVRYTGGQEDAAHYIAEESQLRGPKYGQYRLEGGENYREAVLTIPDAAPTEFSVFVGEEAVGPTFSTGDEARAWGVANGLKGRGTIRQVSARRETYTSPHWKDVPNPIAHVRMQDRIGADGKKTLEIQEIQSDLHNEGRTSGYKPADVEKRIATKMEEAAAARVALDDIERRDRDFVRSAKEALRNANARHPRIWQIYDRGDATKVIWRGKPGDTAQDAIKAARELGASPNQVEHSGQMLPPDEARMVRELQDEASEHARTYVEPAKERLRRAESELRDLRRMKAEGVWSAPFKRSYAKLMLKRILKQAIDEGYDRITLNTGETVAVRFGLDKALSKLEYFPEYLGIDSTPQWHLAAYDLKGRGIAHLDNVIVQDKNLERTLGKEMAERLRKKVGNYDRQNAVYTLKGDDLKVEARGKREFYDKMLPQAAKEIGLKVGMEDARLGKSGFVEYKYEGPNDTAAEVAKFMRSDQFQMLEAGLQDQIRNFHRQLDLGSDEPARTLSRNAAEALGGKIVEPETFQTQKVHSFEIPPELRRKTTEEGQPLYQRGGDAESGAMQPAFISKVSLTPEQLKRHAPLLREFAAAIKVMAPDAKFLPVMNLIETAEGGGKAKHRGATVEVPDTTIGTLIVIALEGADGFNSKAFGTVGHEVVHVLKEAGLFGDPKDFSSPWAIMTAAAKKQNWMAKYRIAERYRDRGEAGKLEEAIAEEVGEYLRGGRNAAHPPLLRKALGRFSDGLRKIKLAVEKFFGKDVSAQEVMERIASGEMGWKRGKKSAAGAEPRFQRAPAVDTPEFKRWFGRSRVVDDAGEPLVLYHSTKEDFDAFEPGKEGIHLGTSDQANMRTAGLGTRLLPVYVRAERLKRVRDRGGNWAHEIALAKRSGHDGIVYLNRYEGVPGEEFDRAYQAHSSGNIDNLSDAQFLRNVPSARDSYIAFKPEQVKSQFNEGSFKPRDPRIMFQRAPAPDTPEFRKWFGKSKVLEPGGEPKVVYHGTTDDFDRFARTSDIGYHFGTAEQAEARLGIHGDVWDPAMKQYVGERGRVLPMYLKIENPLRMPDLGTWEPEEVLLNLFDRGIITAEEKADALAHGYRDQLDIPGLIQSKGYDGIVYRNAGEATRKIEPRDLVGATLNKTDAGPFGWEMLNSDGDRIGLGKTPEDAMQHAKEQVGVDKKSGISVPTGDSYIVFDPRQVKSVFNAGGFDPGERSFMFQKGEGDDQQAAGAGPEAGGLSESGSLRGSGGVFSTPYEGRDAEPLAGLPTAIKIPGHPDVTAGPFVTARRVARDYVASTGRTYEPMRTYARVDIPRAKRIAEAFDKMRHHPTDPLVRRAYRAMVEETLAQWQFVKKTGLKVEFIDPAQGDPYYASPRLAIEDVRNNNHLWAFATDDGFGTEGITAREMADNPLLEFAPGETIGGRPARVNDIFRCFVAGTLVRTRSGFTSIEKIKAGDEVLTHRGRYRRVKATMSRHHRGEVVDVVTSASHEPITATTDHAFYVLLGNHDRRKQSSCTPYICHRKSSVTGKFTKQDNHHKFAWTEIGEVSEGSWFPVTVDTEVIDLASVAIPDKFIAPRARGPASFKLTPEFLWIIGLYIAEGCSPVSANALRFSLHADETDYVDRLRAFARSCGYGRSDAGGLTVIRRGNGLTVSINSRTLSLWFPEWLGRGAKNKAIPQELLRLPPEKLRHLVRGIMDGDGKKKPMNIEQTSETLALQLVEAGVRLGFQPTTSRVRHDGHERHNRTYTVQEVCERRHASRQKKYTWKILGSDCRQFRSITRRQFAGKVYDIEVDEDHSFVVQNVPVHNCVHDYFGHIKDGVGFRADGEENAWRSHSTMYSEEGRKAMTTETRGQNSWLNYGPYGEKNRTAKSEDTVFAEQKIGLLPDWVFEEGLADSPDDLPPPPPPEKKTKASPEGTIVKKGGKRYLVTKDPETGQRTVEVLEN